MLDTVNLYEIAEKLAPFFLPVEAFIMWLLFRKGRGKPLPQWLRSRVFKGKDNPDRLDYYAGIRIRTR